MRYHNKSIQYKGGVGGVIVGGEDLVSRPIVSPIEFALEGLDQYF